VSRPTVPRHPTNEPDRDPVELDSTSPTHCLACREEDQIGSDTEDGSQAIVDAVDQYLGQPGGLLAEQ
jgi:hypothetical protein